MSSKIEHHYATLNGFRFHYATCGQPDKPMLLCVHGFPEGWFAWRGVMESLGEQYYVVAPDTRGINESDGPTDIAGYRVSNMVSDLVALLDHLGQRKCILAGHDWGGAITCSFAIAHPERLHGLVMINTTHPGVFLRELARNPHQRNASAYITAFLRDDAEAAISAQDFAALRVGLGVNPRTGASPEWLDDSLRDLYTRSWSTPGSLRAGLAYYRATQARGAEKSYADDACYRVSVPTLFIWGEQDRYLLTGCVEGLDSFFSDVRVERIPEATHWIIHEQGGRVSASMAKFIESIETVSEEE
ncbi:alpha/beta fold hydrolase [Caballeronia cordobensis]|uniref:alpha/beta fold hydrolase n=1 Tax=Caballeronia cordobensis TaxID=1353886 RepID=UPI00045F0B48|nr:alpha/beta hydrolase fold protein [Burkholderia sp. RPE67]